MIKKDRRKEPEMMSRMKENTAGRWALQQPTSQAKVKVNANHSLIRRHIHAKKGKIKAGPERRF